MDTQTAAYKASIFKAMAHPLRVAAVEALSEGELTVQQIAKLLGSKESNTSRHLGVLRGAGIVATRKEGLNVFYSMAMPCLVSMLGCVNEAICTQARISGEIAERV